MKRALLATTSRTEGSHETNSNPPKKTISLFLSLFDSHPSPNPYLGLVCSKLGALRWNVEKSFVLSSLSLFTAQSVLALPALVEIHVLAAIRSNKTHHSPEVEHGTWDPLPPRLAKKLLHRCASVSSASPLAGLALLGYLKKTFRCQKKVGFSQCP